VTDIQSVIMKRRQLHQPQMRLHGEQMPPITGEARPQKRAKKYVRGRATGPGRVYMANEHRDRAFCTALKARKQAVPNLANT
jgi:hypothetical protein